MLAISVNIFLLGGSLLVAFIIGFMFRGSQLKSLKQKISDLDGEVLNNHAEILDMQKERVQLQQKLIDSLSDIPVIPIKGAKEKDDKNPENVPDISLRKKLLSKQSADKHS